MPRTFSQIFFRLFSRFDTRPHAEAEKSDFGKKIGENGSLFELDGSSAMADVYQFIFSDMKKTTEETTGGFYFHSDDFEPSKKLEDGDSFAHYRFHFLCRYVFDVGGIEDFSFTVGEFVENAKAKKVGNPEKLSASLLDGCVPENPYLSFSLERGVPKISVSQPDRRGSIGENLVVLDSATCSAVSKDPEAFRFLCSVVKDCRSPRNEA